MKDIIKAVVEYTQKGFLAPIPLPAGEKFPPPSGLTGNIPHFGTDKVRSVWKTAARRGDANLALRAQVSTDKDYEIIALDVDHYGEKAGLDGLRVLSKRLGPLGLAKAYRSSSRGPNSPSGQYFFKVPKNIKWARQACPDVDIVQLTHRYSVVWPSRVSDSETGEERVYNWYVGSTLVEVPHVDDLPELPEAWVQHLTRKHGLQFRQGDTLRLAEAMKFLEALPGWEDEISRTFSSYLDNKLPELSGGAHDTMLAVVTHLLKGATEGHAGLGAAMQRCEGEFLEEFAARPDSRLGREGALQEFWSIVCSIAGDLKNEIDSGQREILPLRAEINPEKASGIPSLQDLFAQRRAEKQRD